MTNLSILHAGLLVAGTSAIALPILIHILLRRRRTPVQWGAMRFVLEAYQQQRKRTRLEQILLLLCRCLLVACLGVAIARPFWSQAPSAAIKGPQTLVLLIDNAAASGVSQESGTRTALDQHLADAGRLIADLDAARGDRVGVITLASPAEVLVWPPSSDLGAVSRVLATIRPMASGCDISGGLALAHGSSAEAKSTQPAAQNWALLSEFRSGSLDVSSPPAMMVLPPNVNVVISAADQRALSNVTIADATLLEPIIILGTGSSRDEEVNIGAVRVQLQRSGTLPAASSTVRVSLHEAGAAPGEVVTNTNVSWAAGSRQMNVTVPAPRGVLSRMRQPVLSMTIDRDALATDNVFVLPIVPREMLTVACVAPAVESPLASLGTRGGVEGFSAADWMYLAIEPGGIDGTGTGIRRIWIEPGALATSPLSDVDALMIAAPHALNDAGWKSVASFLDRGGVALIVPGAHTPVQMWSEAVATVMGSPFSMSREPRQWDSPASVAAVDPPANRADPLTLLRPEMTALLSPVSVSRQFVIQPEPTVQPLLTAIERRAGAAAGQAAPLLVSLDRIGAARGRVYLFAAATTPEWTDLPTRPVFVPLIQELLRQGLGSSSTPLVQRAGTALMAPPGAMTLTSLTVPGRTLAVSPRGATLDAVRDRDVFNVVDQRGLGVGIVASAVDTAAANLDVQDDAAVRRAITSMTGLNDSPQRLSTLGHLGKTVASVPDEIATAQARSDADRASANASRMSMWLFALAAVLGVMDLLLGRWFSHASVKHTKSALDSRIVIDRGDESQERAA